MDKICRGSAIGEAHLYGGWKEIGSTVETAHNRGTSVDTRKNKLDLTSPNKVVRSHTSDTFRTGDWFRHLGASDDPPQFSPRSNSGDANSPRGLSGMRVSKSMKSLKPEEDRPPDGSPKRNGVERARSMGHLLQHAPDVEVRVQSLFDGGSPRRSPRSPRSPRISVADMVPAGLPVSMSTRGRSVDVAPGEDSAGAATSPRANSPTYRLSENWMTYSAGNVGGATKEAEPTMPSRNFTSKSRMQHSGRVSEMSEHMVCPVRNELAAEPSPPQSTIANVVDFVPSRGKKMINSQKTNEGAKRRLKLDATQPEAPLSQRKHNFTNLPESQRFLSEFKNLSPRSQQPSEDVADVMHRTSAEMASAMNPDPAEIQQIMMSNGEQRKYMVGREVISWANCGRRGAQECFRNTQKVAAQISKEAGGYAAPAPHSLGNVRDHRNSDVVKEHINMKGPSPKWQDRLTSAPQVMPTAQAVPYQPQQMPAAGICNGVLSFGDVSCLPSTTPKDNAYLQSGLKVYKYGARTPGYFSPHMPHSQILSQGM